MLAYRNFGGKLEVEYETNGGGRLIVTAYGSKDLGLGGVAQSRATQSSAWPTFSKCL